MNRRKLLVLGAFALIAFAFVRRRYRRGAVTVPIEEPGTREETTATGVAASELESIDGIGSAYAERLREAGVEDPTDLATADVSEVATETGIGESRIRSWIERIDDRDPA